MKFAALYVALDATFVEEGSYQIYATLVAYQDNFISQMFWANVKVEYATILIDNELASRKCFLHKCSS
jgi:hypothetical protein